MTSNNSTTQLPETGYLRLRQIIGDTSNPPIIPVSKSTWWAGVKTGRYPKPIKLAKAMRRIRFNRWPRIKATHETRIHQST